MKIFFKNKNGITLISLVVTIIVLLILAGVSIGTLFDVDGLFGKANEATTRWNNAKQGEQEQLGNLTNKIEKFESEDEELKNWKLDDKDHKSPYYPGSYPNNAYLHESKKYGENIKAIKIVIVDCQLEQGCKYDYGLFLDSDKKSIFRLCDGYKGEFYIKGNSFDSYFITDRSVTRRGYTYDIYITENESLLPEEALAEKDRYVFCDLKSEVEKNNIKLRKDTQPKITINAIPYKIDPQLKNQKWRLEEEETVDVNSTLTISNTNGDVLYTQDIHDISKELDLIPNIENYPEEIEIKLERKNIEQTAPYITIIVDYTS